MVIVPLVLALATQPSLAFVARFYKPGGQKSRMELYVSDLDGKHRSQLKSTEEPYFVQWLGHDRLVWTTDKGLWTSRLSPWRPVKIDAEPKLSFQESRERSFEPGNPIIVKNYDSTTGLWRVNPTSLKLEQIMKTPEHTAVQISEESFTSIPNPSSADHPLSLKRFEEFDYWIKGKMQHCEYTPYRAFTTDNGDKLWLVIGTHDSTSGTINSVMLFEKGKEPRSIFEMANQFDMVPERAVYAYCSPRTTSPLGKKEVWSSELHVGDWKKGTDKTLLTGAVWVPSVSVRP